MYLPAGQIRTAKDVSLRSGIREVLPKATLHDHLFEPCGYSMNALEGGAYYTIHVRVCIIDCIVEGLYS